MNVAINLSSAVMPRERYALAWAAPTTLIAMAGLCYLSASVVKSLQAYATYHHELAEFQNRENRLREREAALRKNLEQPQFRKVLREAEFVNALIEKRQLSLTDLTEKAIKLLPGEARLTGLALSHPGEDYVVRFSVEGKSEEALENFLTHLEDSADFTEVMVTNQGSGAREAAGGGVVLTCTALYVGEAARGKTRN